MRTAAARLGAALGILLTMALAPAAVQAAPPITPTGPGDVQVSATGYVYANEAGTSDSRFPMRWCQWYNSDTNWGNDCGGFRNVASYAFNDSNAGNVVRFYYHPDYTGAWACLGPGDVWYDFHQQNIRFTWGAGRDGYNTPANDEVASHAFRSTCS